MAAACLLHLRSRRMSSMQYLVGTVLYDSGIKKKAYTRLSRLGTTVTVESKRRKVLDMTCSYDRAVVETKSLTEGSLLQICRSRVGKWSLHSKTPRSPQNGTGFVSS